MGQRGVGEPDQTRGRRRGPGKRPADWVVPNTCEHGGHARYVVHRRVGDTTVWRTYVAYACEHDCTESTEGTVWPDVVRTEAGKMVQVWEG